MSAHLRDSIIGGIVGALINFGSYKLFDGPTDHPIGVWTVSGLSILCFFIMFIVMWTGHNDKQ